MKKETKRAYQSPAINMVKISTTTILEGSTDQSRKNEQFYDGGSLDEYF